MVSFAAFLPILSLFTASTTAAPAASNIATRYGDQGMITAPAPGTAIQPGQAFDFNYAVHADYCTSSFNYTVWLVSSPPDSGNIMGSNMAGHFFGRFDEENYPAVPFPTHPAPAQLVMPNFSKSPGGFAAGQTASDKTMYLAVLEEWGTCSGELGTTFTLTYNPVIYNSTTVTSSSAAASATTTDA